MTTKKLVMRIGAPPILSSMVSESDYWNLRLTVPRYEGYKEVASIHGLNDAHELPYLIWIFCKDSLFKMPKPISMKELRAGIG